MDRSTGRCICVRKVITCWLVPLWGVSHQTAIDTYLGLSSLSMWKCFTAHVLECVRSVETMVACPRCDDTFSTVQHMIAHLGQIHSNEAHFMVVCNLPKSGGTCYSVFHSFASYKTHMYRYHSGYLSADTGETYPVATEIMCCVCKTSHPSLQALRSHYREHCNEGLSVPCIVKRCDRVFTVISSYTAHMSRHHRNVSLLNIRDDVKCQKVALLSTPVNEICTMDIEDHSAFTGLTESTDTTKNIALLFVKMKAQYCQIQLYRR